MTYLSRIVWVLLVLFVSGLIIATTMILFFLSEEPLFFLALSGFLIIINFLFIYFVGGYILKAVYFPYSNYFITQKLNSHINRRFASDFGTYMLLMARAIIIMANFKSIDSYEQEKKELND